MDESTNYPTEDHRTIATSYKNKAPINAATKKKINAINSVSAQLDSFEKNLSDEKT
jgi:hypothetical protein